MTAAPAFDPRLAVDDLFEILVRLDPEDLAGKAALEAEIERRTRSQRRRLARLGFGDWL